VLEELSKDFDGKMDVYKVNTEQEQELASVFGIRSIPSFLFVLLMGSPRWLWGSSKRYFVRHLRMSWCRKIAIRQKTLNVHKKGWF